jgi:serine/threonine protein phosphatase PrpC
MQVRALVRASGSTHPGLVRDLNEDRFHADASLGVFIVVDGVGGQAAGEKAAEAALAKIRERLESETASVELRIRQAITAANNEIHRLAGSNPEWRGMACVLTVVVLDGAEAVVGHVGDTRLYKIRAGRIEKLTKDHSPVGEREDAGELSEADAMRHPRRNEVYRDVGSEPHRPGDLGFIDLFRVPFEQDAALLLCSDGLSDLVTSETMRQTAEELAGHPYEVVRSLIEAALDAGGKDNVTVIYVEGSRFAQGMDTGAVRQRRVAASTAAEDLSDGRPALAAPSTPPARRGRWRVATIVVLLFLVIGWSLYHQGDILRSFPRQMTAPPVETLITVRAGESIAAALLRARPGTQVIVEPGEYRERLELKSGVQVRSRLSRGASIRLPGAASEAEAAVVADDVTDAELRGFKIVGDAMTPLGTAVIARNSNLTLTDLEISGARTAAVVFGAGASGALLASDLHDNPGIAVDVRTGAEPRISHNTFSRNATSERSPATVLIEMDGRPEIRSNVFSGVTREAIVGLRGPEAAIVAAANWFVPVPPPEERRGRSGRRNRP